LNIINLPVYRYFSSSLLFSSLLFSSLLFSSLLFSSLLFSSLLSSLPTLSLSNSQALVYPVVKASSCCRSDLQCPQSQTTDSSYLYTIKPVQPRPFLLSASHSFRIGICLDTICPSLPSLFALLDQGNHKDTSFAIQTANNCTNY